MQVDGYLDFISEYYPINKTSSAVQCDQELILKNVYIYPQSD